MKKLHTKLSLIGLLFSAMLLSGAFSLPNTALANGTCLGGDGTGTLTWDSGTCAFGWLHVYDITQGGEPVSNGMPPVNSPTRFTNEVSTQTAWGTYILVSGSLNGGGTPVQSDQFAIIFDPSDTACGGTDTYATCSPAISGSEIYPNITTDGSTFDLHVGGGGGGGGGGGNCGLGCAGVPTAYTANFTTTTQQAAVSSAVGDISSFVSGFLPYLIALMFALIILGIGVYWVKTKLAGRGWGPSNGLGDDLENSGGGWIWDKKDADFVSRP